MDGTVANLSQGHNEDVNFGGRTDVHCYRQTYGYRTNGYVLVSVYSSSSQSVLLPYR